MTATDLLTYFLTAIGALASIASVLSAIIPKTARIAPWLAWLAAAPVKHAPNDALARVAKCVAKAAGRAAPIVLLVLPLLAPSACAPTRYPSLPDVAVATVNATDLALATYISSAPANPPVDLDLLTTAVDRAAEIVRRKGDPCLIVDDVTMVGSSIGCQDCVSLARGIVEIAGCQ